MDLPFKTSVRLSKHTKELEQSSYFQLSNIIASHNTRNATIVWIYALIAQFKEATGVNMQLEVLNSFARVASKWDPSEIALASKTFLKLLKAVHAVKLTPRLLPIKLTVLETLAHLLTPFAPQNLTIVHIYLGLSLTPETQRFSGPLFSHLKLDYDPQYGLYKDTMLSDYFAAASDLLAAWKQWDLACVYAKCALSTSNRREPLARLYAKATILQLVAHGVAQKPLPGYISDVLCLDMESEAVAVLIRAFETVSQHTSLRNGPQKSVETQSKGICDRFECENLREPLCNAHKIAWLEALHSTMPRCLLDQVSNSGDGKFNMNILEQGYNARVSYQGPDLVFEMQGGSQLQPEPQWNTLDAILALTKRLSKVPRLAAAPQLLTENDEIDDMDTRF